MQYAHFRDEEKREKVIRLTDTYYKEIRMDDYVKYEDFIKFIKEGKAEALKRGPDISDDLMFVYLKPNYEDHEIYLEYWAGRMETDKEFKARMDKLKSREISEKEDDIRMMEKMAEKYGFKITKVEK